MSERDIRDLVEGKCKNWSERLVDLSHRNPLLQLSNRRTVLRFQSSQATNRLLQGESIKASQLFVSAQTNGENTQATDDFKKQLLAIYRKAQSLLEERGIDTLFLCMGVAVWQDIEKGKDYRAPCLLLPAELTFKGTSEMALKVTVEEGELNPAMLYALHTLRGVNVEPLRQIMSNTLEPEDSENVTTDRVWQGLGRIAETVKQEINDFRFEQVIFLTNLYFEKMAMVEDLKNNVDAIAKNTIVAALAGHKPSQELLTKIPADEVSDRALDDLPPKDEPLILDADTSQRRVIQLCLRGQSCVVQGPPGTGKSQTIANLIAACITHGRSVLFVAEKRAALDAVKKRLERVGLDYLALDLHGKATTLKKLYEQLNNVWDRAQSTPEAHRVDIVEISLKSSRQRLRQHAEAVNASIGNSKISFYEAVGRCLRTPEHICDNKTRLSPDFARRTPEEIQTIESWVQEAAAISGMFVEAPESPWSWATLKSTQEADRALRIVDNLHTDVWLRFSETLAEVCERLELESDKLTLSHTLKLAQLIEQTAQLLAKYDARVTQYPLAKIAQHLSPARKGSFHRLWSILTNRNYRAARRAMLDLRHKPDYDLALLQEAEFAVELQKQWRNFGQGEIIAVDQDMWRLVDISGQFAERLRQLQTFSWNDDLTELTVGRFSDLLSQLAADRQTPLKLAKAHDLREAFQREGLWGFIRSVNEHPLSPQEWVERFRYLYCNALVEFATRNYPELSTFNGQTHEQVVRQFVKHDTQWIELAAHVAKQAHTKRFSQALREHNKEQRELKQALAKKRRRAQLRDLMRMAPHVLKALVPCWMASPLSVSQLLASEPNYFDLVVFDEASQVTPEEAVTSLYRGKQVVVAGDRHQLPPTKFFERLLEDEEDGESDEDSSFDGIESLLDLLGAFLPNMMLEWHYRSKDERLIAFSNRHVYDQRLTTFPAATAGTVIQHVLAESLPQSDRASPTGEIQAVIQQVLKHVRSHPEESLGIIAMGNKHARRIEAAIDKAAETHAEIAEFMRRRQEERLFIKNLETVQGDERDVIILSVGYGKNPDGSLSHNFGPLNREEGYRRLNVAITRARQRMCVISSFTHRDIDLARAGGRGVRLLKGFLEYAESEGSASCLHSYDEASALNPFEADVRDALAARGIQTLPQYGASRFRIDLVALHPDLPNTPILAIECDGASYHSIPTVRDRDRLRQRILESMGWQFHRIWSTDWFYRREQEIARAVAAFNAAVERYNKPLSIVIASPTVPPSPPAPATAQVVKAEQRSPKSSAPNYASIDNYSDASLAEIAKSVMSNSPQQTDEDIVEHMLQVLHLRRGDERVTQRLRNAVELAKRSSRK